MVERVVPITSPERTSATCRVPGFFCICFLGVGAVMPPVTNYQSPTHPPNTKASFPNLTGQNLPRVHHRAPLPDGQRQVGVGAVQGLHPARVKPDGVGLLHLRREPVAGLVDGHLFVVGGGGGGGGEVIRWVEWLGGSHKGVDWVGVKWCRAHALRQPFEFTPTNLPRPLLLDQPQRRQQPHWARPDDYVLVVVRLVVVVAAAPAAAPLAPGAHLLA